MRRLLNRYLAADHDRLDDLLKRAVANHDVVDMKSWGEFRRGLLKHIAMEEKIILPAIAERQGGKPAPVAERLRLDHGALAALLVPPPGPSIVATIISILKVHNSLEEREGGLYQMLDTIVGSEEDVLLERLKAAPDVPVMPFNEKPPVLAATRRAVERAGYRLLDEGS